MVSAGLTFKSWFFTFTCVHPCVCVCLGGHMCVSFVSRNRLVTILSSEENYKYRRIFLCHRTALYIYNYFYNTSYTFFFQFNIYRNVTGFKNLVNTWAMFVYPDIFHYFLYFLILNKYNNWYLKKMFCSKH